MYQPPQKKRFEESPAKKSTSEVVFFGDNLLGAYELPYDDMLKAFTLASKNYNEIIDWRDQLRKEQSEVSNKLK